jgi:hypothetical protein
MIRQRILGVAGTFVVLSFLSHSSSKEYTCVKFVNDVFVCLFILIHGSLSDYVSG